jgi:hypothetical protein
MTPINFSFHNLNTGKLSSHIEPVEKMKKTYTESQYNSNGKRRNVENNKYL